MKNFKHLFTLGLLMFSVSLFSQVVNYPPLKSNINAQRSIEAELLVIADAYKANPTDFLRNKLELFQFAFDTFKETVTPVSTDIALNSAYLNVIGKNQNLSDSEALNNLMAKVWPQEFKDLLDTVKQ